MIKRIFVFVMMGAMFFVGMQFISVFFYVWEFDDFVRDEVKFAPIREDDSKEHLVEHIKRQVQFYGLDVNQKAISIGKSIDKGYGITTLSADVTYTTPVDLFYFIYQLRRHIHTSAMY